MSQVQQFPLGLLDLLGAKGGSDIREIGDRLVPTIETLPFFAAYAITNDAVSGTTNAVGNSVDLTIPSNEFWVLYAASASLIFSAVGDEGQTELRITQDGTPVTLAVSESPPDPVAALGTRVSAAWSSAIPWVLTPGTTVSARVNRLSATPPTTAQIAVRVAKIGPATKFGG